MVIDKIALTLAIIGALNWGSVGLFGFDCVAFLFGGQGVPSPFIFALKIFFTAPQSLPHLSTRALSGGTDDRM